MQNFEAETVAELLTIALPAARMTSRVQASRLGTTVDFGPSLIKIRQPEKSVVSGVPGVNPRFRIAARLAQLFGGYVDTASLCHHDTSLLPRLTPDGKSYDGAFGPLLSRQIPRVVHELKRERNSRRAVIWLGAEPPNLSAVDVPTMFAIQFQRATHGIAAIAYTRSIDLLSGLAVDAAILGTMLAVVCAELDARPLSLSIVAGSSHIYTNVLKQAIATELTAGETIPRCTATFGDFAIQLGSVRRHDKVNISRCIGGNASFKEPSPAWIELTQWIAKGLILSHESHIPFR
jgi:hypothetical protein